MSLHRAGGGATAWAPFEEPQSGSSLGVASYLFSPPPGPHATQRREAAMLGAGQGKADEAHSIPFQPPASQGVCP